MLTLGSLAIAALRAQDLPLLHQIDLASDNFIHSQSSCTEECPDPEPDDPCETIVGLRKIGPVDVWSIRTCTHIHTVLCEAEALSLADAFVLWNHKVSIQQYGPTAW